MEYILLLANATLLHAFKERYAEGAAQQAGGAVRKANATMEVAPGPVAVRAAMAMPGGAPQALWAH